MRDPTAEDAVLRHLAQWAQQHQSVRAILLTSSRANPSTALDVFSDYDITLVVVDIHPFFEDRKWLGEFGEVLTVYRDPLKHTQGVEHFAYVAQYADGTKIDFTLWPIQLLVQLRTDAKLPDSLDIGYAILLDKDHLTHGLKRPTYEAYIPAPPTAAAYASAIEEFFSETTYVAKNLWRDHLLPAKYSLDHVMKHIYLRKMLEWRMEIDHNWRARPGAHGKGLKAQLDPAIWSALEATYVGANREENWQALFRTIDLFRKVAIEVAVQLGYAYPHDLHDRVQKYLLKVRRLDRDAKESS